MQPDDLPAHGGDRHWALQTAGCTLQELIDFSANINPLGPPAAVLDAWQGSTEMLLHYPDPECRELRQALGKHLGVDPDRILCGNGEAELLTWAGRECAQRGTTILPVPTFGDHTRALAAFGARVHKVALNEDFSLPPLPDGDVLLLANPHNPSGKLYSAGELLMHAERFALVVVDEAFMDFIEHSDEHSLIRHVQQCTRLVVLRSMTKFYSLPGLRLGYAVLHPELARRWQGWRDPWSVNGLAQHLGVIALSDVDFHIQTLTWLPIARARLIEGLAALPGLEVLPGSANFLLVRTKISAVYLQRELLRRHRLFIRHCTSYQGMGERFFRVAVRPDADNALLVSALAEVLG